MAGKVVPWRPSGSMIRLRTSADGSFDPKRRMPVPHFPGQTRRSDPIEISSA
jgi:hypothetical protein